MKWVKNMKNRRKTFLITNRNFNDFKVLLPKDYVRFWLTGECVSDMSDSSGTSWMDVKNRCWSKELLDATGLDIDQMPKLVEGTAPSGRILPGLAKMLGLPENVIVAGGAGDNAASACGAGTVCCLFLLHKNSSAFSHLKFFR